MKIRNRIASTLFAIAMLGGVGLAMSATVEAQYPNDRYQRNRDYRDQRRRDRDDDGRRNNGRRNRFNDGYPDLGGSFDLRQTALNAGANQGIKAGRDDRRRGRAYDYRDESDFQKATKDYSSKLGDRGLYQNYFRQAFSHGYADGYTGH